MANNIQNADYSNPISQAPQYPNTAYVTYASQPVGYLANGQYVNVYTVIVDGAGNLKTAFPGFPRF